MSIIDQYNQVDMKADIQYERERLFMLIPDKCMLYFMTKLLGGSND